ncbi:hypothetical protein [Spirochaeta isovalerica]|uniref:Uncharacterized protein n=1 Tax=Spirochaeta isovalerica TaxID=150 RepID=A0A841R8E4_9SPIO|nr:hypothetical protein [Spirochaeta isovalerica]MBB6480165.1 hypothetical protein [Spirochaeta isovalerica]
MKIYQTPEGVEQYCKMAEGYDFSRKVYQHIPLGELKEVFKGQRRILTDKGVIIHSFWIGGKIVDMEKYTEFEDGDSLFIIGVKK